jgi:hypothetical protein
MLVFGIMLMLVMNGRRKIVTLRKFNRKIPQIWKNATRKIQNYRVSRVKSVNYKFYSTIRAIDNPIHAKNVA